VLALGARPGYACASSRVTARNVMNTVLERPHIAASTLEELGRQHLDALVTYALHLTGTPEDAVEYVTAGLFHARHFPAQALHRDGRAILYRAVTRAARQNQHYPPQRRGVARLFAKRPALISLGPAAADAARINTAKRALLATEFSRRASLLLRDLAKLSYREIGVAMECSPEAASRLVASARREFGSIYRDISI
jgi:DNA-directed RNA polymerase specialized sigma24 family protein